jgi:hypothetical protein
VLLVATVVATGVGFLLAGTCGSALAAYAPVVESEAASHVSQTDATLEAHVDTQGLEASYEFHLVGHGASALPPGKLLGSFVGQTVNIDLSSAGVTLTPGERYEYSITVTSGAGTATGSTQRFTASSASSESLTTLGRVGFGTIAVDSARSHILVSGPAANVVDILNYSGAVVGTIPRVYGAYGMVVRGRYLYVCESTAGVVVRFNLNQSEPHPKVLASGIMEPRWLVMTKELLWTTSGTRFNGDELVAVSPSGGDVAYPSASFTSADLAVANSSSNTLFVAEDEVSPGSLYRVDVSSGAPTVVASSRIEGSNIQDLAVSPDGTRVVPASGAPYHFVEFSAETLQPDGLIYPGSNYPTAVAFSEPKPHLIATGIDAGGEGSPPDIWVDPVGVPAPILVASAGASRDHEVLPHGLAFSPDGASLFAIFDVRSEGERFSEPGETLVSRLSVP